MKIILLENINQIGKVGDIINVRNGYAKNYLIPKKKCVFATSKNIEHFKSNIINKNYTNSLNEIKNAKKLNNITIIIPVTLKNNEEIYGSFTIARLLKIMKNLNIKLNIKNIKENISIKKIGIYKISFSNKKINMDTNIHIILLA